ncbi:MAG: TolB family protein [Povalibacter sp.]
MRRIGTLAALIVVVGAHAQSFTADRSAELWLPDLVSTAQAEVRITFSPDGQRMLWGAIDWSGGVGGWDIYESQRTTNGWSKPAVVSFDSTANDFDPSFAPDGSGVFFFSNRQGGFGKDDLYFARFDAQSKRYGKAENLGAGVNTAGEEWAPVQSRDGTRLMFASDGHGGAGKHDLFTARKRNGQWMDVLGLAALNSADEDFDAAFLDDDQSIVFSRGDFEGTVALFVSKFRDDKWQQPVRLPTAINSEVEGAWTFGPSIAVLEPGVLYFTSRHAENRGRVDIYRIRYSLSDNE